MYFIYKLKSNCIMFYIWRIELQITEVAHINSNLNSDTAHVQQLTNSRRLSLQQVRNNACNNHVVISVGNIVFKKKNTKIILKIYIFQSYL